MLYGLAGESFLLALTNQTNTIVVRVSFIHWHIWVKMHFICNWVLVLSVLKDTSMWYNLKTQDCSRKVADTGLWYHSIPIDLSRINESRHLSIYWVKGKLNSNFNFRPWWVSLTWNSCTRVLKHIKGIFYGCHHIYREIHVCLVLLWRFVHLGFCTKLLYIDSSKHNLKNIAKATLINWLF